MAEEEAAWKKKEFMDVEGQEDLKLVSVSGVVGISH